MKRCKECGVELINNKFTYCSPCGEKKRRKNRANSQARFRKKPKIKEPKAEKPKKPETSQAAGTIFDDCRLSDQAGLSYGKWKNKERLKKGV